MKKVFSAPHDRRTVLKLGGASVASLVIPTQGLRATEFPPRPITVISPFAPGGLNDISARVVAKGLEQVFKQTVITENRPGGSTIVGMSYLARSEPDGCTLLTCSDRIVCFPTIGKTPFDIEKDFAPITRLVVAPMFLVTRPGLGVNSLAELIEMAKSKGDLTFASTGSGSTTHLTGELFKLRTGVKLTHVPFRGALPALNDVLGGHIDIMFADMGSSSPFIMSGQLHALAVASAQRNKRFPDVPTFAEAGVTGFEKSLWIGLLARAGTPAPVIERLNEEVARILANPDNARVLENLGADIATDTPKEFAELISSERARVAPILKAENIRIN